MNYKNRYYDVTKKHHTRQGFCNSEPFSINYKEIRKWQKERKIAPPEGGYQRFCTDWYQEANFSITNRDAIWWLGHATALIKINNKIILTDPVFFDRVSPVPFIGPKRYTPCASSINNLPQIDIIVISHNHYDHLDYRSVLQLIERFPLVTIVVPLGLKKKIQAWGATRVIELDWWQDVWVDDVLLSAIPAKHWSRRGLFDINKTLWCGWMIESNQRCVYFVGDTGYSVEFTCVKKSFPNIDIALIPVGSYAPRWFMHNQHIDPAQALQLFHDIGCKRAIAIHWGTFELADDSLDEPPKLLKQLLPKYNLSENEFLILKIGDHIQLSDN
ncbi:MBL fold metallo-hydrolase [Orbus sturtevantii]|uniref:MBL fold metallo-hydrolase n=1 Tax=Orbus sturtevantii TaxID=3074109 RepID=UPI00370D08A1